jgi:hypothetical protein
MQGSRGITHGTSLAALLETSHEAGDPALSAREWLQPAWSNASEKRQGGSPMKKSLLQGAVCACLLFAFSATSKAATIEQSFSSGGGQWFVLGFFSGFDSSLGTLHLVRLSYDMETTNSRNL